MNASTGEDPRSDLRARIQRGRARLVDRHRRGDPAGTVVADWARLIDGSLRLLAGSLLPPSGGMGVAAVGGYGRGELYFGSDIDIWVVHGPGKPPREVPSFFRALWDLGLEAAPLAVDIDQLPALAAADWQLLTAGLEMRFLWGDRQALERLAGQLRRHVLAPVLPAYLEGKRAEFAQRHRQGGNTVYLSEPDVKESPGGLRDLHTLLWLSNAEGGPRNWTAFLAACDPDPQTRRRLQEAVDLLQRVRNALHLYKERRWDRLDHRSQLGLAEWLGYTPRRGRLAVERFMRDYYRGAREVYAFARLKLDRAGSCSEHSAPMRRSPVSSAPAVVRSQKDLSNDPLDMLRRFAAMNDRPPGLDPETVASLHARGSRLGSAARKDPGHGAVLWDLLRRPGAAARLNSMHQFGFLGGMLPEFEPLTALVQFDPFHHYTVDEHTMRVLDHGERRIADEKGLSCDDAGLLRLALLFHDVGKGQGYPGHAERGARLMGRAARRLGLNEPIRRDAVFLVRYHLLLSSAAQRRDIRDPALQKRLCRIIRTPRRLRLLQLITLCDLEGVGPGVLSEHKIRQIEELVGRLQARLQGTAPPEEQRAEGAHRRIITAAPEHKQDVLRRFLNEMPHAYVLDVQDESVSADADRMQSWRHLEDRDQVAAWFEPFDGATVLTIIACDRPWLLSRLCGLLAAHDVTIRSARIYTRRDAVVFDRLIVSEAAAGGPVPGKLEEELREVLRAALEGSMEVAPLLEAHRERWRLRDRPRMRHPVRVVYDPAASDRYTVIEVRTQDQVGLLYTITSTLAELGAQIHQAFITTEGERAVDAFYLTDPLGVPLDEPTRKVIEQRLRQVLTSE